MLNSAFDFALNEFSFTDTMVLFSASLSEITPQFNDGYLKWNMNGLGEAYGFMFQLKQSREKFRVYTLYNIESFNEDEDIEWHIDAKSLDTALEVFKALNLNSKCLIWKKGDPRP